MDLAQALVVIVIVGAVLYLVNKAPLVDFVKTTINVVVCLLILLWVIRTFMGSIVVPIR